VHDNILLGAEPRRFGVLSFSEGRRIVERALAQVGPPGVKSAIEPNRLARALAPSERQLVAIARALASSECRLLILDEPTSSLTEGEVQGLFEVLGRLTQDGLAVVYISHFLEEVRRIAQRFT